MTYSVARNNAAASRNATGQGNALLARQVMLQDCLPAADQSDYSWGVNEITRQELFDPALINAIAAPGLIDTLEAILDEPRAWGQKMLWAPKQSHYNLGWHRDIDHVYDALMSYKPARNDHVQFNAALEYDNSFIVVPQSHRRPISAEEQGLIKESRTAELPGQLRVELEPGDVVCMDAHALHRGQADAGAPRLSLHYSFQSQWVPLLPWEKGEAFKWICSDDFINQLHPRIQPMYRRLTTAERARPDEHHLEWLVEHAEQVGFKGDLVSAWD